MVSPFLTYLTSLFNQLWLRKVDTTDNLQKGKIIVCFIIWSNEAKNHILVVDRVIAVYNRSNFNIQFFSFHCLQKFSFSLSGKPDLENNCKRILKHSWWRTSHLYHQVKNIGGFKPHCHLIFTHVFPHNVV